MNSVGYVSLVYRHRRVSSQLFSSADLTTIEIRLYSSAHHAKLTTYYEEEARKLDDAPANSRA